MEEITNTVAREEQVAEATARNFDITSFTKAKNRMIATNDRAYDTSSYGNYYQRLRSNREYTAQDIENILDHGSLEEQQKLSRHYFYRDGYYK
jgi:hypothetical protein